MADTLSRPRAILAAAARLPRTEEPDDALRRRHGFARSGSGIRAAGPDHDLAACRGDDDGPGPEHAGLDRELFLQPLRHAHALGQHVASAARARDLVEERQRDDVGVYPPPGREVPRRLAAHG